MDFLSDLRMNNERKELVYVCLPKFSSASQGNFCCAKWWTEKKKTWSGRVMF